MNARARRDPAWLAVLDRGYGAALRLYPRAHRERWGMEMRHTFRERCRQAARERHGLPGWLLAVGLPDLLLSSGRERLAFFHPKQGIAMSRFANISLAVILEVGGAGLLALSSIGLTAAIAVGRFSYPGTFDAGFALQVAMGVAGIVLLAIGIRGLLAMGKPAA